MIKYDLPTQKLQYKNKLCVKIEIKTLSD